MKKLLILIVFFSSCSKENLNPEEASNLEDITNLEDVAIVGSSSFFEENFKNKIVVVAGGTIEEGAVVWINNKKILLLNDALEATGLFYQDNKIYVTGWTYGGKGSVWIMDLDGSNQTVMELEGKYSEGQRIMVHNGDIYTGGFFDNGSCYWKNGSKIDLTKNADSMSWGIAMDSNNNLFNVGYYMSQHHSLIPAFWKNGKRNKLNRPQHGDGEAKYIKIIGNKKIIGGTTSAPHNFLGYITKPTYWINGNRKTGQIGSIDEGWQNCDVFDMFVDSEENIYLAGFSQDMDGEYPTYWKNGQKNLLSNGEATGVIRSLKVIDGDIIAAGTLSYFPGTPCLWVGEEKPYVYDENAVGEVWDMLIIDTI